MTPSSSELVGRLLDLGMVQPVPRGERFLAQDVTVIVPVRDHTDELARLLEAHQAFEGIASLIVVDDGSKDADGVRATCARTSTKFPTVVLRQDAAGGPASVRNIGAARAETRLLVFLDADCRPEPGWLEPLLAHFDDENVAAAAPRLRAIRTIPAHEPVSGRKGLAEPFRDAILAYELELGPLDRGDRPGLVGPGRSISFVPTAALAVRHRAWHELGGFDASLRYGEDLDFGSRLAEAGWTTRYEPSSIVGHEIRPSTRDTVVQRYRYALPIARLAERHDGAINSLRAEPASAAAWMFAGLGLVPVAAVIESVSLLVTTMRLCSMGFSWRHCVSVRLAENAHDGAHLARGMRRDLWPMTLLLAVLFRRFRPMALTAAVVPPLLDWRRRRPRLRAPMWLALSLLDGAVHGAGVWKSCITARRWTALKPAWKRPAGWTIVDIGDDDG